MKLSSSKEKLNRPTEKQLKRLRLWVWVFLIASIVGGLLAIKQRVYWKFGAEPPSLNHLYANALDKTILIYINDEALEVPLAYFDKIIPKDGEKTDGIFLIAMYPHFGPLKESQQDLWEKGVLHTQTLRLSIYDPNRYADMAKAVEVTKHVHHATEYIGKSFGLNHFSQPSSPKADGNDVYVEGDNESPVSYIQCSHTPVVEKPGCIHHFLLGKLLVKTKYSMEHLSEWKAIQEKSVSLIETFRRESVLEN